nr:hypothetical protein [Ruminococcus callidus]
MHNRFSFCGGSPLTLRPNFKCEKGSVTAAAAACLPRRGIFAACNLRVILDLVVQVQCELFSFFASFFLFSKESGKLPLTLRPNFKCKKGNVTADKPPVCPAGGFLLMCNLRVVHCRVVQVQCELFSFFASFFLFSKEKKKRNSL